MSDERRPKSTVINAEPSLGEVEELLRAAQEDLLLKLSVDTHTTSRRPTLPFSSPSFSSSSSSSLHPDLRRRFDALRSHRAPAAPKREPPDAPSNQRDGGGGGGAAAAAGTSAASAGDETSGGGNVGEDEVSKILGDDLAARFAALKGSSSSYLPAGNVARIPDRIPKEDDGGDDDSDESDDDDDDDGVSKKEVEKLMQWAMDAARLDPHPSNSDDGEVGIGEEEGGGGGGGESAQDEEDDAAARADEKKKKGRAEGKNPLTRKWFFF